MDEMGQRRTIRLVTNIKRSETYQTIPTIEATPSKEERGSIRAFGISLLHSPTAPVHPKALVPSRARISPNKHRTPTQDAAEMPDPPAWIRPRAGSPTSQILSPPLHPHLFLHPTISNMSIAQVQASGASESGSDYGSDEDPHTRTTASRRSRVRRRRWLARTLPPRTPRSNKTPRTPQECEQEIETEKMTEEPTERKTASLHRLPKRTTGSAMTLKRNPTAPASRIRPSPSTNPVTIRTTGTITLRTAGTTRPRTAEAKTATTLSRSTGVKDLSSPSKETTPRPSGLSRTKSVKPASAFTSSDGSKARRPVNPAAEAGTSTGEGGRNPQGALE